MVSRKPRVVATLTTIPSGVKGAIEVIEKLLEEPEIDLIYFNLPEIYGKDGSRYPKYPVPNNPRLKVLKSIDRGPITKVYPVLDVELDPETLIFIVDDDHLPESGIIGKFLNHHRVHPDSVLTTGGWIRGDLFVTYQEMSRDFSGVREVDWVEGAGGILAARKYFPKTSAALLDYSKAGTYQSLFKKHDDHWLSWHFREAGATLRSIPEFYGKLPTKNIKSENISGHLNFQAEVHQVATFLKSIGVYQVGSSFTPLPWGVKITLVLLGLGLALVIVMGKKR